MKATIDVPDDLYRQVKAKSALEGRALREVAVELFRSYVTAGQTETFTAHAVNEPRITTILIDGNSAPAWFGRLKQYAGNAQSNDMDAIRASIARGVAVGRDK